MVKLNIIQYLSFKTPFIGRNKTVDQSSKSLNHRWPAQQCFVVCALNLVIFEQFASAKQMGCLLTKAPSISQALQPVLSNTFTGFCSWTYDLHLVLQQVTQSRSSHSQLGMLFANLEMEGVLKLIVVLKSLQFEDGCGGLAVSEHCLLVLKVFLMSCDDQCKGEHESGSFTSTCGFIRGKPTGQVTHRSEFLGGTGLCRSG